MGGLHTLESHPVWLSRLYSIQRHPTLSKCAEIQLYFSHLTMNSVVGVHLEGIILLILTEHGLEAALTLCMPLCLG